MAGVGPAPRVDVRREVRAVLRPDAAQLYVESAVQADPKDEAALVELPVFRGRANRKLAGTTRQEPAETTAQETSAQETSAQETSGTAS